MRSSSTESEGQRGNRRFEEEENVVLRVEFYKVYLDVLNVHLKFVVINVIRTSKQYFLYGF